jgi:DNA-binding protein YbaB
MIKGNFKVKKVKIDEKNKDKKELEALIKKSGAGSHMVFRSDDKSDDELFIEEL